jgi:hypothetical protein
MHALRRGVRASSSCVQRHHMRLRARLSVSVGLLSVRACVRVRVYVCVRARVHVFGSNERVHWRSAPTLAIKCVLLL